MYPESHLPRLLLVVPLAADWVSRGGTRNALMNDDRISSHLVSTLYDLAISVSSPISEAQTAERHVLVSSQAHHSIACLGYKGFSFGFV